MMDIYEVTVVMNGPLGMSPGKMVAQSFQLHDRLVAAMYEEPTPHVRLRRMQLMAWWSKHTTTIARIAKTPAMWGRLKCEVGGVLMIDEGFTEVEPGSETCFVTWPYLRAERPKLLNNAKIPLL